MPALISNGRYAGTTRSASAARPAASSQRPSTRQSDRSANGPPMQNVWTPSRASRSTVLTAPAGSASQCVKTSTLKRCTASASDSRSCSAVSRVTSNPLAVNATASRAFAARSCPGKASSNSATRPDTPACPSCWASALTATPHSIHTAAVQPITSNRTHLIFFPFRISAAISKYAFIIMTMRRGISNGTP